MAVEFDDREPIMFDLGTGARFFGLGQPHDGSFSATVLLSHLHWDHVQGLPFFTPILRPGASLDIYAPKQAGRDVAEAVRVFMAPPYFPVELEALPGDFTFNGVWHDDVDIGGVRVRSAPVPHVGETVGYRVSRGGRSVVYISDHQQPGCEATTVDERVLELCEGADVLIHDAQYTTAEFPYKHDWGHCTIDYAVEVAAQAGVDRLVLFHHDPGHDDRQVDANLRHAAGLARRRGVREVLAAYEGLQIPLP